MRHLNRPNCEAERWRPQCPSSSSREWWWMVVLIDLVKHSVHPSCVPPNHPSDKGRLLDLDANLRGWRGMRRDCRLFWKLREGLLAAQTEQDPHGKITALQYRCCTTCEGTLKSRVENSPKLRQAKRTAYHVSSVLTPCLIIVREVPSQLCLTTNECTCLTVAPASL